MRSSFDSLVPLPRSREETGEPFAAAVLDIRADAPFLGPARALREDLETLFGASVVSPGSAEEECSYAEGQRAAGRGGDWGGNFRPESARIVPVRFSRGQNVPPSAYELDCAAQGIALKARDEEGACSARAVLLQLLALGWDGWRFDLPSCRISDAPAFSWRGLMVDSARHFVPIPDLERLVRAAAAYGIDRLHWHLTDDQGWRLPLLNEPSVADSGSFRPGADPHRSGRYERSEIRAFVEFARGRGVVVVPEIDLPGHVQSVLAGRPDLCCAGGPQAVRTTWGISDDVLCMGNPASLAFALAAWDEACDLFPGPWVHLGGDECPTARWETCPRCAARKAELGLRDWVGLHGRFMADVAAHLRGRGKIPLGWDEVLDAELEGCGAAAEGSGTAVVHWRAWLPERGEEALARGRDLVRSPSFPYYLDFVQHADRSRVPGMAYKTEIPADLRAVYGYDPLEGLAAGESAEGSGRGRLLGVQANAWTEFMRDPRRLEYMVFPRLLAVAETAWLGRGKPGWESFRGRLSAQRRVLERFGLNYCPLEFGSASPA